MLRAVLFDLDDTLYPEWQYVKSGFHAVATWLSPRIQVPEVECFDRIWSMFQQGIRKNTFNQLLAAFGNKQVELVPQMIDVYRNHAPVLELYPDVLPILKRLKHRHIQIGLISDGTYSSQKAKFDALGLFDYISNPVFTDVYGRENWKPSTYPFLKACELLLVEPQSACYVADNPTKDFIAPRQLEMTSFRIRRSDGQNSNLEPESISAAPDHELETLEELLRYLPEPLDETGMFLE